MHALRKDNQELRWAADKKFLVEKTFFKFSFRNILSGRVLYDNSWIQYFYYITRKQ